MDNTTLKTIDANFDFISGIKKLKKELNAVILAHYYQDDDIQEIADFVGDSLDLSRRAAKTSADTIIFCGVKFMAETAFILNPEKLVLLPDIKAGCSLEESCQPTKFAAFKAKHPDHIAITYVNCSAEIKALSDIIVTSTNAAKIIDQLPLDQKIIFAPDKHLGRYLNQKTGRNMLLWNGTCEVHENFSEKELIKLKTLHPKADIIAHPECPESLLNYAKHIGSTSSLIQYAEDNSPGEFIVLTEPGIIHEMKKRTKNSKFYDVPSINESGCTLCNTCPYMKLNTLEKLYLCMLNKTPSINISPELVERSKKPLLKMLEMSK
jgi:quinolinate synthase